MERLPNVHVQDQVLLFFLRSKRREYDSITSTPDLFLIVIRTRSGREVYQIGLAAS
jgi:hypothetical protein